jgi:hypothetical protein
MKKFLAITAAAAVMSVAFVTPVDAKPPQEQVVDDFIVLFPDTNINRSVFVNITARAFCDWLGGPLTGPPPAMDEVTLRGVSTGQGAIVGKIDAKDLYIEIWTFDENPSPLVGPCDDIQDQLDIPTAEPWATGTADFKGKTNDADIGDGPSGTRGVSFGDRTTAHVTDQEGNSYRYSNVFRLNEQCNVPELGPPSCLVDNSQLKML